VRPKRRSPSVPRPCRWRARTPSRELFPDEAACTDRTTTERRSGPVRRTGTRAQSGFAARWATPIVVGRPALGGPWSRARPKDEPLPPETEVAPRQSFTDLMATAIANAEARHGKWRDSPRSRRHSGEWRRLVAEGAAPTAVLDAGGRGNGGAARRRPGSRLKPLRAGRRDHRARSTAGWDAARTPVGHADEPPGRGSVTTTVRHTARPAPGWEKLRRSARALLRSSPGTTGLRSSVAAARSSWMGRLWGIITASWKGEQSAGGRHRGADWLSSPSCSTTAIAKRRQPRPTHGVRGARLPHCGGRGPAVGVVRDLH